MFVFFKRLPLNSMNSVKTFKENLSWFPCVLFFSVAFGETGIENKVELLFLQ